jgi:hypothetical protein
MLYGKIAVDFAGAAGSVEFQSFALWLNVMLAVYLDLARIFCCFRLRLHICNLHHFALRVPEGALKGPFWRKFFYKIE